ncbi:MAG: hypothetical protein QMD85_03715 [Candidatus Aenigmarchaeota archaeon]|nr:hypothetical protein [Candidatus Aenigmarchaeota archaeon]MDI6722668.1 hypothetical protein [Candidatus Aenigmarchaeota archaeon]
MVRDDSRYNVIIHELIRKNSEDTRRLRNIEQRLDMIENRMNSLEESSLDRTKKLNAKASETDAALKNLSDEMSKIRNNLEKINRQVNKFARKQDIKEMERMMELLTPLKEHHIEEKRKIVEQSYQ